MGAVVSLDGFMADDSDGVGPSFDWLGNGGVAWRFPGSDYETRSTQASADFMLSQYADMAANVIGRRVFDLTDGWNGKPAAGEHVFVVTHQPPTDWEYADTAPFTFVDGVEKAIAAAQARADRSGGGQPGPGGLRLRPSVLRHRRPGRAAAVGEPKQDRARRPSHPPGLRRRPLRPAFISVPAADCCVEANGAPPGAYSAAAP